MQAGLKRLWRCSLLSHTAGVSSLFAQQKVYLLARSEAIKAIKRIFDENAIPMPVAARK